MRIAMMVRAYIPVPRPMDMVYANIDLAMDIAQGLSRRGHTVDMYAPLGSKLKHVKIVDCNLQPLASNLEEFRQLLFNTESLIHGIPQLWDNYMASEMFRRALAGRYDILHYDHPESAMVLAKTHKSVPVVYTLHDPIHQPHKEAYEIYQTPNQHYISISDNQRRDAPDLPYLRTIHHGIDTKLFAFSPKAGDYLLYYGRIVPEKGVREAIAVAKASHHRLLIIGPTYPDEMAYFDRYVKPQLDERILYLGYIEREHVPKYIQKAKALLTPVQWEEPFGLTSIEAMSCGTPVISFNRGAAPEIIKNGHTGFVVDTTTEMIEAVNNLKKIKRQACRDHITGNYTISKMVKNYELAFKEVLSDQKITPGVVGRRLRNVPNLIRDASRRQGLPKIIKTPKKPK